jgi:hypothetical protein
VRWKPFRIYFADVAPGRSGLGGAHLQPGTGSSAAPMNGYPKVFNIESDPREEHNVGTLYEWVTGPTLKVVWKTTRPASRGIQTHRQRTLRASDEQAAIAHPGVSGMKTAPVRVALGLMALQLATSMVYAAEEMPAEIIAVQIRDQGYACGKAVSAKRDEKLSRPDEAAWILKCDNATYRVRLIPDMAAKVERLE